MTTRTFIDDSMIRDDTPLPLDLSNSARELDDLTTRLTADVAELAGFLGPDLDLNANRDLMRDVLMRLVATAGSLSRESVDLAAIRDKAAGNTEVSA